MIKEKKQEIVLILILMILTILMGICFPRMFINEVKTNTTLNEYAMESNTFSIPRNQDESQNDFIYLSDIDYIASQSKSGWGSLLKDTTSAGGKIAVKVEGAYYTFDKGMWAHASSQLVYDLHDYDYKYFTAFLGLNQTAASSSNGVKFYIYTSQDGSNWTLQTDENPAVTKPGNNATFVKINIENANYLKLIANDNGANGNDHAVYADAKLTNAEDDENIIKSVAEYDEQIKRDYPDTDLANPEYELLLLQRNLVKNMGQYAIKRFVSESTENLATFNWLFNDLENLRIYTLGGVPEGGSYYNSLTVLRSILEKHISDFAITEQTKYGTRYGDLYKKMAIALSLTHSKLVGLWMQSSQPENQSDAVTRYEIYKMLHKNNKFVVTSSIDITKWFENYTIEEMRFVMNNNIDDEEILWLNEYTQSYVDQYPTQAWKYLTPHPYMAYVWPNYSNPIFHDPERKDYWDEKFNGIFSKYGVTYRNGLYKVWMNFRNEFGTGAVCGGISKTGANIRGVHGIPAAVIGQPGHAAIIYYSQDAIGNGYWNLDNDVSGWTLSEKGERMLLGWGNANFSKGYSVVYMALAQEVINNNDTFEASEKLVYLADVYHNNLEKQEEIYRKALDIQPLNIDAWYGLINNFNANTNKTEADYFKLAEDIGENLKYFPLPMLHLTNLIKPKLTSIEYEFKFTLLQTRILTEGSKTPNNTEDQYYVYQPSLTRLEANYLLGKLDKNMATFSFDGENAGKLILASRFNGSGVRWDYSLDGKQTWNEVYSPAGEDHSVTFSQEQLASITAENDIYVHIVGANYTEENIYKIDILDNVIAESSYFANDLENRVMGIDLTYEWRNTESDSWTSYKTASPDNTGNKTLQIRQAANGVKLASNVLTFTFTEDAQDNTRKYIPVSHLTIDSVSTEAVNNGGSATNAIDGNYNTRWHSAWNGTDTNRFIVIKLDKPVYLSAVEFVPAGGGNGKIYDGTIYGSLDGENWEKLAEQKGLTYTNQANTNVDAIANTKSFDVRIPKEVQYIKIVADRTNGNWFAARAFNLFQDITDNEHPTAGIGYSTTEPTTKNVVARLVNPSTNITITNNNGSDTYTFTENGSFTFEFENENGIPGSATAKVDWIDKEIPTASIEYDITTPTTKDVVASLININEDIYLLDEDNNKVNFVEIINGTVSRIEYLDVEGKITKILYLNAQRVTEKIEYYYREEKTLIIYTVNLDAAGNITSSSFTNEFGEPVVPEDEYEIRKLDAMGRSKPLIYTFEENGEYTFRLQDKAGNRSEVKAKVNWIDREIPTANITYDINETTTGNVVATITLSEAGIITNNNGSRTYTFTKNGEFTFEYQDLAGNKGSATAKVDWIEKKIELPDIRLHYSEVEKTMNPVTVMLVNQGGPIRIINNNGSNTYTFTKNGEFTFEYLDATDNFGSITAKVDWIIEKEEDDNDNSNNNNNSDNNNQSNNSSNNSSGSGNNQWTTTTPTKKPTSNTKLPSIDKNPNPGQETNNDENTKNEFNDQNNEKNNITNDEENKTQEEAQKNDTKEENSNKIKFAFIGLISFIIVISFLRFKFKRKK